MQLSRTPLALRAVLHAIPGLVLALWIAPPPARAETGDPPTAEEPAAQVKDPLEELEELDENATPPPLPSDIDEMVVRGRQRDDLLQDVPVSVTSFGSAELKALRIKNIADLAQYTPNLEINTAFAASNPTLFIRGIGLKDYNANAASAVAVYQDGININSPAIQLFQLFDVESVDILRGPQGSLNGRNATAGAIMVNSVMPGPEFDVSADFTYGNYNTVQAEGAITLPLIDDVLSARVAFTANFRDGTVTNQCANWDPVAQGLGNAFLAGLGTDPWISARSSLDVYQRLGAHPGVFDPGNPSAGPNGFRAVSVRTKRVSIVRGGVERVDFGAPAQRFVYLGNLDPNDPGLGNQPTGFISQLNASKVANVDLGAKPIEDRSGSGARTVLDRWELNEPITLSDGTLLPAGTAVGLQQGNFQIDDEVADGVCLVKAPGRVATYANAIAERPIGAAAGEWAPFPEGQVTALEDLQGLKKKLNNIDNWAGRGVLRYTPSDSTEWVVNIHGGQNRSDSSHLQSLGANGDHLTIFFEEALEAEVWSQAAAARIMRERNGFEGTRNVQGLEPGAYFGEGGADPFRGFYNRDGTEFLDTVGVNLRGQWEVGPVVVRSLTGYEWYERLVQDEGDSSPIDTFPAEWEDEARQLSQELRMEGEGERYVWRSGLFFLYEQLDAFNLFPDTRQLRIEQTFDQTLTSLAPYLAGRFFFSEELTLDAGLRYNVEHKDFALGTEAVGTTSDVAFDEIPRQEVSKTWTAWTGDATLSYSPVAHWLDVVRNDGLTVYGKYARGMKGGHFNAGLTIRGEAGVEPRIDPVEPEFIHSVELGFKSRWLEDRMILNVAAFRYWYKDLQVFDIINEKGELPLQQLVNGDAAVLGGEVEFQARPLPGLLLQAGLGLLDSRFVDLSVTKAVGQPRGEGNSATFDYKGNPLIAAPKLSASGVAEWEIPLFGWGFLVPQYDFSYRSKTYLDPQHADPISQDAYWLHNARLAYRTPDGRIEVAGWVQNFLDEHYKIDVFDLSRDFNTILEVWGDPITYGVTISYAW